jgi:leucyl-tRNA---protein transferase
MDGYLSWDNQTISDFSETNIEAMYARGYVFTRLGKGVMNQTRSLRINLEKFELSSENRRVIKHAENIAMNPLSLPLADYDWHIHKMGKEFYEKKFGEKTFSAQKIKELITGGQKSSFNLLLEYKLGAKTTGYCVCLLTKNIFHYCYPFYDLAAQTANMGMGMMLKAILYAKDEGKKYFYLGSAQRPADIYKLQFAGLEWFDGKEWQTDAVALKKILSEI